ncbi:DUF1367 family protein [Sneathiella glossodoripedis]|uniref:DUF1367 family protein n=1 Tax=Sneathiella glossodoripedis TaxID=418853 RepID=UPI000471385F|nr:DUF1367 family protein [Sneathiella glossodoripedis]
MAKIFLKKDLGILRPADSIAEEYIQGIGFGKLLECAITQPRNIKHHRRYWSMVGLIFKNQRYFQTKEDLHNAIKIKTGYSTVYQFKDGTYWHSPGSIKFRSMDQVAFEIFENKAVNFITSEVVPGLSSELLKAELEGYL